MAVATGTEAAEPAGDAAAERTRGPAAPAAVTALATTPVKGLRICARSELTLARAGAVDNRRFYLVDDRARMVNGKGLGILSTVRAEYDHGSACLTMAFPDGAVLSAAVRPGSAIETRFFSRTLSAHLVEGPWSEALSSYAGTSLRLVEADPEQGGVDRGPAGSVSLISDASIERLAGLAGRPVDPRRFRMLIQVGRIAAHAEDAWVGATIRIGAARVRLRGHVGRCLVTSRDPESGVVDMPTLELLAYRRDLPTTERLAFGVFGEVVEPGLVRLGDVVEPG